MSSSITVRKRRGHSAVPDDILENSSLRLSTRLVLAWMVGRPPGWVISIEHMKRVLGISDNGWKTVKAELTAHGYFVQGREQDKATGQIRWVNEIFDEPQSIPPKPTDGERTDGAIPPKPIDGFRGDNKNKINKTNKTHTPPASGGRKADPDTTVPIPKAMAHCGQRAQALLRRARSEDRAAIVFQVDGEGVRDPAALLTRLCSLSAAGEYLPPSEASSSNTVRSEHDALLMQRQQKASEHAALKRLQASAAGDAALNLQRQADRLAAELRQLDEQLRMGEAVA